MIAEIVIFILTAIVIVVTFEHIHDNGWPWIHRSPNFMDGVLSVVWVVVLYRMYVGMMEILPLSL